MDDLGNQLSLYCYAAAIILTILIGLLYATRRKVMPYHIEALETPWDEIDHRFQLMMTMMLNGGGYYGISTGVATAILWWIPFRAHELWAGYAIGIVGLLGAVPLALIVNNVKSKTKGNPPLWIMVVIVVLYVVGLLGMFV